mmetsp:Transcript_27308/g.58685  ORF Transcript_27308/g.58685 Transcript_27308/m.58685 type:complete len:112 (-) Transcript_27308:1427-1762(-)
MSLKRIASSPLLSKSHFGFRTTAVRLPAISLPLSQQQKQRSYSSINCNTQYNICFVRHGQSTWNRDNRFIGWTDTPLTEDGVLEARVAGQMLQSSGILFDEAHTVSVTFSF